MAAKKEEKQVAKTQEAGMLITDEMPDYLNQGPARGSEDVGAEDLTIPRLDVIQAISPELKKNDPKYIPGAEAGMLFNSVTRELYGEGALVVPVLFKKQWLVWKDRQAGGGFRGAFDTPEEAANRLDELAQQGESGPFDIVDTAQHLCLIINKETGKASEIAISMARSKMKVSRQWNSIIRMAGGDRFSRVYLIGSVEDSSDKGDFYNFHISQAGYPSKPLYQAAESLYNDMTSGDRKLNVAADDTPDGEVHEDKF